MHGSKIRDAWVKTKKRIIHVYCHGNRVLKHWGAYQVQANTESVSLGAPGPVDRSEMDALCWSGDVFNKHLFKMSSCMYIQQAWNGIEYH
jgi:hypothetical protein